MEVMKAKMQKLKLVLGVVFLLSGALGMGSANSSEAEAISLDTTPASEWQAAMQRLSFLAGNWDGVHVSRTPEGEEILARSADTAEFRLGGAILTVAGRGYAPDAAAGDAPVIENFGIFDFDTSTEKYRVTSYALGRKMSGTGYFRDDGKFQWELDAGGQLVRFLAWAEVGPDGQKGWVETGDFSFDGGRNWAPAFTIHFSPANVSN